MLHRPDKQRVKQQYICPLENVVVERSEIVKGYEYRKNEYVVVEPEEIKQIEPKTAKNMEILHWNLKPRSGCPAPNRRRADSLPSIEAGLPDGHNVPLFRAEVEYLFPANRNQDHPWRTQLIIGGNNRYSQVQRLPH